MNLTEQQVKKLKPLLTKLVNEVKQELNEDWRGQELSKFEKWAALRAKALNYDLDEYIEMLKMKINAAY